MSTAPNPPSAGALYVAGKLAERMFEAHAVNDLHGPGVHLTRAQLEEVLASAFMVGAEAYRHFGAQAHVTGGTQASH